MDDTRKIIEAAHRRQELKEATATDTAYSLLDKAEAIANKVDSLYFEVKNAGREFNSVADYINDARKAFDGATEELDDITDDGDESVKEASTAGSADMLKAIEMMDTAIDLFLKGAKASGFIGQKKLQDAYTQYKTARNQLSWFANY